MAFDAALVFGAALAFGAALVLGAALALAVVLALAVTLALDEALVLSIDFFASGWLTTFFAEGFLAAALADDLACFTVFDGLLVFELALLVGAAFCFFNVLPALTGTLAATLLAPLVAGFLALDGDGLPTDDFLTAGEGLRLATIS